MSAVERAGRVCPGESAQDCQEIVLAVVVVVVVVVEVVVVAVVVVSWLSSRL